MKNLVVMVGIPGSGKSTFVNDIYTELEGGSTVVSRDDIRFSLVEEDEPYFSKEVEVYDTFIRCIKDALTFNTETVFADATHLTAASRTKLLHRLGSSIEGVELTAMVIQTDLNTALKRNKKRKGRAVVPASVIRRMNDQFEFPSFDEGFDKIIVYNSELADKKYTVLRKDNDGE